MSEDTEDSISTHEIFTNEVILRTVFSCLRFDSLKSCQLVNHLWHDISSHPFHRKSTLKNGYPYGYSPNGNISYSKSRCLEFYNCAKESLHPNIHLCQPSNLLKTLNEEELKSLVQERSSLHLNTSSQEDWDCVHKILSHITDRSHLKELSLEGWMKMDELGSTSLFPDNFPELQTVNLQNFTMHMSELQHLLRNIFSASPNLREINIGRRFSPYPHEEIEGSGVIFEIDQAIKRDFTGLYNQISKLTFSVSSSFLLDTFVILGKFTSLKSLWLKGIEISSPEEWSVFNSNLPELSSSLTTLNLDLIFEHSLTYHDAVSKLAIQFPCFTNLETLKLNIKLRNHQRTVIVPPILQWQSVLDQIEFGVLFPRLKMFILNCRISLDKRNNTVLQSNNQGLSDFSAVYNSLRKVIIKVDYARFVSAYLSRMSKLRLSTTFPNATIFFNGKFLDREVLDRLPQVK